MINIFIKNSIFYVVGNILNRGISFFLLPVYTRYLSPEEYGIIDLFNIFATIVILTVPLEITQALARFYQDTNNNNKEKALYVSTAFWFSVFMYACFLIISYINADFFSYFIFGNYCNNDVYNIAIIMIVLKGIFYFVQNQLKWQLKASHSLVVGIINVIIVSFVSIVLLAVTELKIKSIFIGQICGNSTAIILAILFAKDSYILKFRKDILLTMLKYSFPIVFSSVAVFISIYIDRIFISKMMNIKYLGIYGVAYKFASVANIALIAFQHALTPLIFKYYKKKETPTNIAELFRWFLYLSVILLIGSIFFSKEILKIMVADSYYVAADVIPILLLSIFLLNAYIFAPGLNIAKKTKTIASINIYSACINATLNILLIPIYGLNGAAFATLASSALIAYLYFTKSNRIYYIPYNIDGIKIATIFTLIVMALFFNEYCSLFSFLNAFIMKSILYIMLLFFSYSYLKKKAF